MTEETEAVKVFCRLKPPTNPNSEFCVFYEIKNQLQYLRTVPPAGSRHNAKEAMHIFNGIFTDESTQRDLYENVAFPLVKDLLRGKNGLLFTYGVTGSGKTYTMQGTEEEPGIVPRALKSLFGRIGVMSRCRLISDRRNGFKVCSVLEALDLVSKVKNQFKRPSADSSCSAYLRQINDVIDIDDDDNNNNGKKVNNCTVVISLVEIYGKTIRDLLANKSDLQKEITIKEDSKKNKYLHNAVEIEVQTAEEAFYWYLEGQRNRKVESTKLNIESSRSHMVFNIRLIKVDDSLDCESSSWDTDRMWVSQLSLVDLAGSERANRTGTNGMRLKEAGDINNSLMVLRRCMEMLRDNNNNNSKAIGNKPDYRSSELTHLFKTTLEGGGTLRMIVCVQSSPEEYDETMNVLMFAENSQEISIAVQKNPEPFKSTKSIDFINGNLSNEQIMEKKLNGIWKFVERKRMVMEDKIVTDGVDMSDIECILELKEKSDETVQIMGELWNMIVEECSRVNQDQLDILTVKLSKERLVIGNLKKQVLELQGKLSEKDVETSQLKLEIANLRKNRSKQDEKIRLLEGQLKNKEEEARLFESRLLQKKLHERESLRIANEEVCVKTIAKKFENNIECSSKKFVSKYKAAPLPTNSNRKGFFNPRYRKSRSADRWVEHKEKHEIPTGTFNRVKIASNCRVKNTNNSTNNNNTNCVPDLEGLRKGDKYLLQHQSVDSDAEVKVSYHKGNIIPTAGGGVAVSLYDVETVTQRAVVGTGTSSSRKCKRRSSVNDNEMIMSYKRQKSDSSYDSSDM